MITKVLKPIGTWLIKANTKTTTRLIKKLIAAPSTDEITIVCFGKFNLRKRSPRETMESIPILVASVKKPQKIMAKSNPTA